MKVASVQFHHRNKDKAYNLSVMDGFVQQAVAKKVELVIFPEMCVTGYYELRHCSKEEIHELSEELSGPSVKTVAGWAKEKGISIGFGIIEKGGDQYFNTYVVAMPDGRIESYRKIHTFINKHMSSGDSYKVFELPNGRKAGILICYDNNIGENVRMNALMGAEIIIAPHQTGGCVTPSPLTMGMVDRKLWDNREKDPAAIENEFKGTKGRAWLHRWLPARAHDNGVFYIFSNGVGPDDEEVRTGNATILDCYGNVLAETWKAADDMVVADFDFSLQATCLGRRWISTRRPELYHLLTQKTGNEKDVKEVRFAFSK